MNDLDDEDVQPENALSENGNVTTINRVLALIDNEIDDLRSSDAVRGWTHWAIIVAIGTAIWLLFKEIETGSFHIQNVALLYLSTSFAFYAVRLIGSPIIGSESHSESTGRIRMTNQWFAAGRLRLFAYLVHFALLTAIAATTKDTIPGVLPLVAQAVSVLFLITLLLAFILSFFSIPISRESGQNSTAVVASIILGVVILLMALGYVVILTRTDTEVTVDDLRMTGLIVAVTFLLLILSSLRTNSPIRNSLINIRRSLALGRISIDSAISQLDVAIAGLKVQDVLQEDVSRLLDLFSDYASEARMASKNIKAMRMPIDSAVRKAGTEESLDDELILVLNIYDATSRHLARIDDLNERMDHELDRLGWRMALVSRFSTRSDDSLDDVMEKIREEGRKADAEFASFQEENEKVFEHAKAEFRKIMPEDEFQEVLEASRKS